MLIHLHIPDKYYLKKASDILFWVATMIEDMDNRVPTNNLAMLYHMYYLDPESQYPIDLAFHPFAGNAVNEVMQNVKFLPQEIDREVFKSLAEQFKSNYTMPEITILPEDKKVTE